MKEDYTPEIEALIAFDNVVMRYVLRPLIIVLAVLDLTGLLP